MYADAHGNRQPFANAVHPPSEHAHYQTMVDDAIAASQDGEDLQALDAHLEHIRIYDSWKQTRETRVTRVGILGTIRFSGF